MVERLDSDLVVIDSRWMAFDVHNLEGGEDRAAGRQLLSELRRGGAATLLIDHDNKTGQLSGYTTKTRHDDVVIQLVPDAGRGQGRTPTPM